MDEAKAARRIRDRERVKAKAIRLVKGRFRGRNIEAVNKMAENFSICSCWGCGNPRRHFKAETMQELRAPPKPRKGLYDAIGRN